MTDHVFDYLVKGSLQYDLPKVMGEYEGFTGIGAFYNNSNDPHFFYEWTVQGMIYDLLCRTVVGTHYDRSLLFLEQPYTATDASIRSDIMWVDISSGHIGAMELKTNFSYASFLSDMQKLIVELKKPSIAVGVMVFLTDTPDEVGEWIENAKAEDPDVKNAMKQKVLYPVGMAYSRQ